MESSFSISWNDGIVAGRTPRSYFSQNDTKYLDDIAHSTTLASNDPSNGYSAEVSNQFFANLTAYQPGHADKDVKFESQQHSIPDSSSRKRAKVAHSDTTANVTVHSPARSKGKQKKCLSLLLEMPLDILYEIFGHLHPRDIIYLSRTSKIFRETLLSRSATTVWKAVCNREGAPGCPGWMSEPAWAALLFEHVCQSCGARNIQKIDFLLLKRVCLRCKKMHLVCLSGIYGRYPEAYGLHISSLLPATNISSWSHKYTRKRDFYWDTDVDYMITRLSAFKLDIELGLPDAQRLQDEFKDEQMRRIKYIKENFGLWNDWHMNKQSSRRLECILDKFLRRMATLNAQVIPDVVTNTVPSMRNTDIPPKQAQSTDDSDEPALSQETINFERDFEMWLHSTQEISLADAFEREFGQWFNPQSPTESMTFASDVNEGSGPYRVDKDNFDQWFTEADYDWYRCALP